MKTFDLRDLLGVAGLILVGAGAWMIFPPAALIVMGGCLIAAAIVGARR